MTSFKPPPGLRRTARLSSWISGGLLAAGLIWALTGCSTVGTEPIGPAHHVEGGFRNTEITDPNKTFFHFLAMRWFGGTDWADHAERASEVPVRELDPASLQPEAGAPMQVSWLGHSTFLIQKGGINILTDPIFADRASPLSFSGPARYVPHVIDYRALPKIDFVVISHNHYDHLDETALSTLGNEPVYLVPLGHADWLSDQGIARENVMEFDWWDELRFGNITFQAMPSQHWSGRGLFDRRTSLWASWLVELDGTRLWFAGDTGYNDKQFREIGRRAGPIDLAFIPIGAYEPRDFMQLYHVNPEEAVRIHRDIGARQSIGMHWGTFPLTAEGPIDPVEELGRQRRLQKLTDQEFDTMAVGEIRQFPVLGKSLAESAGTTQ